MPEFVPKEGQREMTRVLLKQIPQPDLIVGLYSNTAAEIASLGLDAVLANLERVDDVEGAGVVNGEHQFTPSNWVVPDGAQTGDPATHPNIVFAAPIGGTTNVAGYYVRSTNGVLWIVGLHPDVEAGGALKAMVAGATYSVVPSLDTESPSLPGYQDSIEIEDTSYSAVEGTVLIVRARRTTNNPSPGAASVNWSIAGLAEGAPTTSSGTLHWNAGESGLKTYAADIGLVTAQRVGSFAISSPVTASLGARTSVNVTITDDTTSPAAVSLSASAVSSGTINLTFSGGADAGSGLLEYVIERSLDGSSGWAEVARPTAAGIYSDSGRSAGTQYFYRIAAYDRAGNASGFATANATTHGGGGFFAPDIGLLANGNTLVSSGTFDDVNRAYGGDAVVQSATTRPGGHSKCIDMTYVQDESQATLGVYDFPPTPTLFVRKWEMFSGGWANNWPVGFKTARYFTDRNSVDSAYCSEKFIWQRYTFDGGSAADPVWGLNHATFNNDRVQQYTGAKRPTVNTWHKFETYLVINSAPDVQDGILRCWLDDELVFDEMIAWRSIVRGCPNGTAWTSLWLGGNCSFSPESDGWPYPTGQTLHRYLDSPYISTTLDR